VFWFVFFFFFFFFFYPIVMLVYKWLIEEALPFQFQIL